MPTQEHREKRRLRALKALEILDTPAEPEYDDLVLITSRLFAAPIALVSLMDSDRQWFKARFGLDLPETQRSIAFCDHVVRSGEPMVVPNATEDERFRDNPLVTGELNIRAYAGVPLRSPEGDVLGTLCFLDSEPRDITEDQVAVLEALSRIVERQFALRRNEIALRAQLATLGRQFELLGEERTRARQFTGDLVHDMRNPITAVTFVLEGLRMRPHPTGETAMIDTAIKAMRGLTHLIDDLLVVQQLRDGRYEPQLSDVSLREVVEEAVETHGAAATPPITIDGLDAFATRVVRTDRRLVSRIVGNLVANAVRYAGEAGPITVRCEHVEGAIQISVQDCGPGVPTADFENIFQRFTQLRRSSKVEGLGFGLAFSRAAARALGGELCARPAAKGAHFELRFPLIAPEAGSNFAPA